ncbi:CsgG/HfaB family protein [Gemmatimonadota bacterium]
MIPVSPIHNITQEPQERIQIGVLDLVANTVTEEDASAISERLRFQLHEAGVFQVLERNQMETIMDEIGFQSSGACNTNECIIQIGQILGMRKMVAGSVSRIGNIYVIQIRIIDMETAVIDAMAAAEANTIEGLLRDATRTVADELSDKAVGGTVPRRRRPGKVSPEQARLNRAASLLASPLKTGWMTGFISGPSGLETQLLEDLGRGFKGGDFGVAVRGGRFLAPKLLLFLEFGFDRAIDPEINYASGATGSSIDSFATVNFYGAGLAYYLMPQNIYLSASLIYTDGVFGYTFEEESSSSSGSSYTTTTYHEIERFIPGVGVQLALGKEWIVAHRLSLGLAIRAVISQQATAFGAGISFCWDMRIKPPPGGDQN